MLSLSSFTKSINSVSLSDCASYGRSESSPIVSKEVFGHGESDTSYDRLNLASMLPSKMAESNLPCRTGYN